MFIPPLLKPAELPDGLYLGLMSGHWLKTCSNGEDVYKQCRLGVRGINVPHWFKVIDGLIDEDTIEPADRVEVAMLSLGLFQEK